MNTRLYRNRFAVAIAAAALMIVSAPAFAEEDDDTVDLPRITDGRINYYDLAAPVAIFENYDYPYSDDPNMGVLESIEFWGLVGESFDKVLHVSVEDLEAVTDDVELAAAAVAIASNFGYTLSLETDGSLTLTAPTDANGVTYQFNWSPEF
ncbi:MAG: hypothetical protein SF162_12865 [bacterium]|nr:hypothetical protein [bacterium]